MKAFPVLALTLVLLACGCASASVGAPREGEDTDSFRFVGGNATTARLIRTDYLWSATGDVQQFRDGYRGTWRGETVDLRTRDGEVEGTIGGLRTELHLERKSDGYVLRGLYRGHLGELWVGATEIEGSVGRGWVSVARVSAESYSGYTPTRAGGDRHQRTLGVPVVFASLPAEQQALYLALLIGA